MALPVPSIVSFTNRNHLSIGFLRSYFSLLEAEWQDERTFSIRFEKMVEDCSNRHADGHANISTQTGESESYGGGVWSGFNRLSVTETAAVANRMLRRGRDAGRTAVERVTETEGWKNADCSVAMGCLICPYHLWRECAKLKERIAIKPGDVRVYKKMPRGY